MVKGVMEDTMEQEQEIDSFFETPSIEVPKTPPDAHRAQITGVTFTDLQNDKGTTKLAVGLVSLDDPTVEERLDIFLPKLWVANIGQGNKFDPSTLPEVEGNNQRFSYRMGIANSDGTATMQRLYKIARDAGRDPRELDLNPRPADIQEYADNYNKLLTGLEVIFLRREQGGEGPFAHQLQVKDILSSTEADSNPKRFKKYVKQWEQN